jgi:hypothetical protein
MIRNKLEIKQLILIAHCNVCLHADKLETLKFFFVSHEVKKIMHAYTFKILIIGSTPDKSLRNV